jgi:hypothetical protein
MDKILRPVCLVVILALVLSLGVALAPQAMANYDQEIITVDKWVTPTQIWQKGSGMTPETATVTLTVTGGVAAARLDITVVDTLPSYINLEDAFTISPTSIIANADGSTTMEWYGWPLEEGETWTVSFKISSDICGSGLLVDVPDNSFVSYMYGGEFGGLEYFPEVYIDVLCLEVEPARLLVRNLLIQPAQAYPGDQVTISADVVNQGGVRGSKNIELVINGQAEQSIRVGVDPGAAQHLTFTTSKTVPGTYEVYIEGQASAFNVLLRPHVASTGTAGGLSTGAIIAIVVIAVIFLAGMIIVFMRIRR